MDVFLTEHAIPIYGDFDPTSSSVTVDQVFYDTLYSRFTNWCAGMIDLPEDTIGTPHDLSRLLSRAKWKVRLQVRHRPVVGLCTECVRIKADLLSTNPRTHKADHERLLAERRAHNLTWQGKRALMHRHEVIGKLLVDMATVTTDGAASHSTVLPSVATHTKQEAFEPLTVHVQGVQLHGQGIRIYTSEEYVRSGGNLVCTTLTRMLQDAAKVCELDNVEMPRKFYLQVDGGSENWNKTVIRFCVLLVYRAVFDVIHILRGVPGHGHNSLDGIFGRISQHMHGCALAGRRQGKAGHDIVSHSQFRKAIELATAGDRLAELVKLEILWDFDSYLAAGILDDIKGYGAGQRADFTFGESVTWIQIKALCNAADGRRLFMQHKVGHLGLKEDGDDWLPKQDEGGSRLGFEIPLDGLKHLSEDGPGYVPFKQDVL